MNSTKFQMICINVVNWKISVQNDTEYTWYIDSIHAAIATYYWLPVVSN